jgi:DNA-binding transcriptional ArsR family regulator
MNPLQLLSEPNRVEILRLVWTRELAAGEIAGQFRITFGAVSQHLGALWRAGLLVRRRAGKQIFYAADREALGPLAPALEAMWKSRLGVLKTLAEAEERSTGAGRRGRPRKRPSGKERP